MMYPSVLTQASVKKKDNASMNIGSGEQYSPLQIFKLAFEYMENNPRPFS